MPYKIQKAGKNYEVINSSTGRVLGTHSSKKDANAQLAALAIRLPEEFKKPAKKKGR